MANPLVLAATKQTPDVNFNPDEGTLEISGECYPEYPALFWDPLLDWLNNYLAETRRDISVTIDLSYYNSTSSRCLIDFLSKLEGYYKSTAAKVSVKWHYVEDDDMMLESGEDMANFFTVDFEFKPKPE